MDRVRILRIACGIVLLCVFLRQVAAADEAEIRIGPSEFEFRRTDIFDQSTWQHLTLAIKNEAKRTWRFSRFYDCWKPILISRTGETVQLGYARDATAPPRRNDFPYLRPGQAAKTWTGCKLIEQKDALTLVICDRTGGQYSAGVEPGQYKLAISYRVNLADMSLFHMAEDRYAVNFAKVWSGWQVSNWINVSIKADVDNHRKE